MQNLVVEKLDKGREEHQRTARQTDCMPGDNGVFRDSWPHMAFLSWPMFRRTVQNRKRTFQSLQGVVEVAAGRPE